MHEGGGGDGHAHALGVARGEGGGQRRRGRVKWVLVCSPIFLEEKCKRRLASRVGRCQKCGRLGFAPKLKARAFFSIFHPTFPHRHLEESFNDAGGAKESTSRGALHHHVFIFTRLSSRETVCVYSVTLQPILSVSAGVCNTERETRYKHSHPTLSPFLDFFPRRQGEKGGKGRGEDGISRSRAAESQ